ncbi:MAG TPA: universal stress protein [Bacteroidetes bacterium]|nr:universal stress protein [Bacteroidota bacterium]
MKEKEMIRLLRAEYKRARDIKEALEEQDVSFQMVETENNRIFVNVSEEQLEKALAIIHMLMEDMGANGIQIEGNLKKYRKILVPVDFTPYSENACYVAIGLAKRLNAEIELLHAYIFPELTSLPFDDTYSFHGTMSEYMEEAMDNAKERLKKLAKQLRQFVAEKKYSGVSINYSLLRGLPADAISYMEESYQPDVIVVGTRSLEKRREEDSSVLKIIRGAGVPVLVVPESSGMEKLEEMRRIAFATDFDESDFGAIRKLSGLIAPFGLKVYCVHIGKQPVNEKEKNDMKELQQYFSDAYPELEVECLIVENEEVIAGLDEVILSYSIDVIAVTTHKRNIITQILYPSLTKKLFFHTNIPMLVFHS